MVFEDHHTRVKLVFAQPCIGKQAECSPTVLTTPTNQAKDLDGTPHPLYRREKTTTWLTACPPPHPLPNLDDGLPPLPFSTLDTDYTQPDRGEKLDPGPISDVMRCSSIFSVSEADHSR